MLDVTEDEITQWNSQMALDDGFWAASPAVHGIRESTAPRTPIVR